MKQISFSLFLATCLLFGATSFAAKKSGVQFEDVIRLKKNKLVLNGVGVREATVFNVDVYVAGIYLTKKTKNPNAIINSNGPKVFKMQFVRDVSRRQMNETWDKALAKAARAGKFSSELDKLKRVMPKKVKKGDRLVFAFGKNNTYLTINGKRRAIFKGDRFSKSLLSVWFGKNPPNKGLKAGLLGLRR